MTKAGEPPDPVVLSSRLEVDPAFPSDQATDPFVSDMLEVAPHPLHVAYYSRFVRDASARRRVIQIARQAICQASDGSQDVSELVSGFDRELAGRSGTGSRHRAAERV